MQPAHAPENHDRREIFMYSSSDRDCADARRHYLTMNWIGEQVRLLHRSTETTGASTFRTIEVSFAYAASEAALVELQLTYSSLKLGVPVMVG